MPVMFCLLVSCGRPNQTSAPQQQHNPPPFNPDYFRTYDRYHYAVKMEFNKGVFRLAENKVYKVPGRSVDLKKLSPGKFNISYFDNSNQLIDEIRTISPLEVIKEKDPSMVNDTTLILLDSVTFFLPLHTSNRTRRVAIDAPGFLSFSFPVPYDTSDVIAKNQQLVPDTSWIGGKKK